MNVSSRTTVNHGSQTDTSKLVSLLALATGAVALPQTGNADIIYTSLGPGGYSVGFAANDSFQFILPGTAAFGFHRLGDVGYTEPGDLAFNYRMVLAGDLNESSPTGGVVVNPSGFITRALPYGAAWDGDVAVNAPVGIVGEFSIITPRPAVGYDHLYMAWLFLDTTQGSAQRYGWAEVSLSMNNYAAGGPTVTIWGYAYDNTGALPTMGQQAVPEPTSGALLVMGAMALGARGLRKWRQSRPPLNPA